MRSIVWIILGVFALTNFTQAQDEHWSRQFKKPRSSTKMLPGTGMADGTNKPIFRNARWHNGKLYFCGAWEPGVSGWDIGKRQLNHYWYLWAWSPEYGYEPICHRHTAQGGVGPDGMINDFLWLPDGRLIVAGEFTRLDNPGGICYHKVGAIAFFDPKDPTANKWKPLGSYQYNGNCGKGSVKCLAYDPQGNDLYFGGTFAGVTGGNARKEPLSPKINRYDFDTGSIEPLVPGVRGSTPVVYKIAVDTSTKPSTIYVGGKFHYTAGNGKVPSLTTSTSRYSTGFAKWQEGKGWTTYPQAAIDRKYGPKRKNMILQRAADFKFFDGARVLDFLLDGKDIWIVGAFTGGKGTGQNIRGIAKWDEAKQMWTDPTGKGGVGREVYNIAKADNGKIYFAGSFGGRNNKGYYDGFKNGEKAHLAMSYDPETGKWEQLGSGLEGRSMPECRLMVHGNDVYFFGDFNYIGAGRTGRKREDKNWESWYIARWNETIDFVKNPPKLPKSPRNSSAYKAPTQTWSTGNEHWSRAFPKPPRARGKKSMMSGKTGMDDGTGTPNIAGVIKVKDTLYFCGRWEAVRNENWYVWSHHPHKGWNRVAWQEKNGKITGPGSPPKGMKLRDGKIWVFGAIRNYKGIAIYDIGSGKWNGLRGKTVQGKDVFGASADPKRSQPVNDIAWDSKTGDIYIVGSMCGFINPKYKSPKAIGQVLRIDKNMVYHPMGHMLMAEYPPKPVLIVDSVYVDETKQPSDIYIGGTFNFYGEISSHRRMLFNIARWNRKIQDWGPVGKGTFIGMSPLDRKYYPEGLPGLPALPEYYRGFLAAGFPRIRCMAMDNQGSLYVGGTLGIIDNSLPVYKRKSKESFGIAKLDAKTQKWIGCTKAGGVSGDIFQMTFLDNKLLLISGGFHFDEAWNPLHGAAILDITTGDLTPFGGGLLLESRSQVVSSDIRHWVEGENIYFAGFFDHAGFNANELVEAPIQSYFVAHWNGTENFDPNRGLIISPVAPIKRPSGYSSKSVRVKITAKANGGTITWYEKRRDGKFKKKGSGTNYTARLRIRANSPAPIVYVTVTRNGMEGGKKAIRIPLK